MWLEVIKKILDQITVKKKPEVAPASLGELLAKAIETEAKEPPALPTFQAIDDARRLLGEAFRGEADEGYKAIGNTAQKKVLWVGVTSSKRFCGRATS